MLFVMTKSDLVQSAERAELLENAKAKIGAATERAPSAVTVIPVSSAAKADFLEDRDPADLAGSNFSRLETELWSTVTRRRARVHLGGALAELETAAQSLLRPLDDELTALTATTERRLNELKVESTNRRRDLERLRAGSAEWRTELRHELERIGRHLQREADRLLAEVWARCDTFYVPDAVRSGDLLALSARLKGDLGLTAGTLAEVARRRAARVLRDFSLRHGLQLSNPRIDALPAPDVLSISDLPPAGRASRYLDGARGFSEGSDLGDKVGSAIGVVVDFVVPGAGQLVGGFLGKVFQTIVGVFNLREAVESHTDADRQARIAHLRAELAAVRGRHRDDLTAGIDDVVDETLRRLSADLDNRIALEIGTVDESLRRLTCAREQTSVESAQRRAEIDGERLPLQRMLAEVDELAMLASQLGGR
jgi:hypothetical protein